MAIRFNRSFNVNRVVKRLVRTVLALYVGGTVLTTFGTVMLGTCSPFYKGLTLIGYGIGSGNSTTLSGSALTAYDACGASDSADALGTTIMSTTGAGILAVVGIIAIAQIVTEFITW